MSRTWRWILAVFVVAVIVTGLIAWAPWRDAPTFAWEECEAPSIDETRGFDDFEPAPWRGSPIAAQPFADIQGGTDLAFLPGSDVVYVTTKPGLLYAVTPQGEATEILDLSAEVSGGAEQGLLSVAFSPESDFVYVTFTNLDGDLILDEYQWTGTALVSESRRLVLEIPQPQEWHNGGHIAFGPDDYLYMGLGDGGGIGDPHGNGQSRDELYASIIRFDPKPDGDQSFTIPPDNPFVGTRNVDPLIFAWGLRNPWRFSFDRESGDLWIGDVGQNCVEEINLISAGSTGGDNFGWSALEGTYRFQGYLPGEHTLPVLEYTHDEAGCSITGGYVYRGTQFPDLSGMYLFADYCRARVFALQVEDGMPVAVHQLDVKTYLLSAIGEDLNGEIYLLTQEDGILKLVGG